MGFSLYRKVRYQCQGRHKNYEKPDAGSPRKSSGVRFARLLTLFARVISMDLDSVTSH
jgi:hypothetical protein